MQIRKLNNTARFNLALAAQSLALATLSLLGAVICGYLGYETTAIAPLIFALALVPMFFSYGFDSVKRFNYYLNNR